MASFDLCSHCAHMIHGKGKFDSIHYIYNVRKPPTVPSSIFLLPQKKIPGYDLNVVYPYQNVDVSHSSMYWYWDVGPLKKIIKSQRHCPWGGLMLQSQMGWVCTRADQRTYKDPPCSLLPSLPTPVPYCWDFTATKIMKQMRLYYLYSSSLTKWTKVIYINRAIAPHSLLH